MKARPTAKKRGSDPKARSRRATHDVSAGAVGAAAKRTLVEPSNNSRILSPPSVVLLRSAREAGVGAVEGSLHVVRKDASRKLS
jgi:hypothetical protein